MNRAARATSIAATACLLAWLTTPAAVRGADPDVVTFRLDPILLDLPVGTETCVTATADLGR